VLNREDGTAATLGPAGGGQLHKQLQGGQSGGLLPVLGMFGPAVGEVGSAIVTDSEGKLQLQKQLQGGQVVGHWGWAAARPAGRTSNIEHKTTSEGCRKAMTALHHGAAGWSIAFGRWRVPIMLLLIAIKGESSGCCKPMDARTAFLWMVSERCPTRQSDAAYCPHGRSDLQLRTVAVAVLY